MRRRLTGLVIFVLFLGFRLALTLESLRGDRSYPALRSNAGSHFFPGVVANLGPSGFNAADDRLRGGVNGVVPTLASSHGINSSIAPTFDLNHVRRVKNSSVIGGIAAREATYQRYWDPYKEDGQGCHPSCFCEFPDQATCVGPRITYIPTRLNPFLTLLEIVDASLLSIRTDSFHPYPHLQHLSLINCSVVKLEAFAFRGLSGLKTFNFNLNPLTHLSRYSFSGVYSARVLNLTQNRIKRIHSLAFESSSNIGKLLLYGNPLSHISARAFLGLSIVENLVISEVR